MNHKDTKTQSFFGENTNKDINYVNLSNAHKLTTETRRHGGIQKYREQNRPTYFVSSSVSRELQLNAEDIEDENEKVRAGRTY